jgi:hypothetical protein
MFIGTDDRFRPQKIPELDVGGDSVLENNDRSSTTPQPEFLLALVTSTELAPVDGVAFAKKAGEIIAMAARLSRNPTETR